MKLTKQEKELKEQFKEHTLDIYILRNKVNMYINNQYELGLFQNARVFDYETAKKYQLQHYENYGTILELVKYKLVKNFKEL